MAGHNKWSKVKRLKAVTDARKGKVFSRLSRDITLAAKAGGGDPNGNARLRTLLRRSTGHAPPPAVQGAMVLDPLECTATVQGRPTKLTKKEFALLAALLAARGRVVPREVLLGKVWGHLDCPSDAVVEYFVHMLRKKVGRETIRTVAGVGYAVALPETGNSS